MYRPNHAMKLGRFAAILRFVFIAASVGATSHCQRQKQQQTCHHTTEWRSRHHSIALDANGDVYIGLLSTLKLITYNIKILLVNESGQATNRRLKKVGGFSNIDYDKFPLNKYNSELIFTWKNRQVVLIK